MDAEPREKVLETTDRVAAQLTLEVLVAEDLDAVLEGVSNAALLGAAPHIFPLAITVPAAQAERARELIAAMEQQGEPAAGGEDQDQEEDDDDAAPAFRKRSPVLAAGCTFVIPAGCHFYARRSWTALTLLAGWVAAFVLLGASRHTEWLAAAVMIPLLGVDLVGGLVALRAENRGQHASRLRQVGSGLLLLAIAGAIPGVPGAIEAWRAYREAQELATLEVTCTLEGIQVANHTPTERSVELGDGGLRISYGLLFEDPTRQTLFLELPEPRLRVPAGGTAQARFADPKNRHCGRSAIPEGTGIDLAVDSFARPRLSCSRSFHLSSTREGAPSLDTRFTCPMPTDAQPRTAAATSRR
ncbi:MAG: DUF2007 domain-containing protein [Myxococcales bacterium]